MTRNFTIFAFVAGTFIATAALAAPTASEHAAQTPARSGQAAAQSGQTPEQPSQAEEQSGASPRDVIAHFDSELLATMKQADTLGFAGRYKKLAPLIDHAFALDTLARLALGPKWASLSAKQQADYKAMFRKDTIATYAERFDGYSGERFEITQVADSAAGRKKVNTDIVSKSGDRTSIDYILQKNGSDWQIINIVAKGVSSLALKRGQYTGVIRKKGPDGFIKQFHKQLDKYPKLPEGA